MLAAFALIYVLPPLLLIGLLGAELRSGAGAADRDRARARQRAAAYEAELEVHELIQEGLDLGLGQRADGMFDGRSHEGRRLNAAMAAASEAQALAEAELRALTLPLIWRAALRAATVAWVAGFVAAYASGQPPKAAVLIAGVLSLAAGGIGSLAYSPAEPDEVCA